MRLALVLIALASVAAFASGCGGSSRSPPAVLIDEMGPPSKHDLARLYLLITAPANAAIDVFDKRAKSYNSSTTTKELADDLAPVIAAVKKADSALLRLYLTWPPSIRADVKAQVTTNAALIGDLQAPALTSSWFAQVARHGSRSRAAADIVRADLGLPPVKP